MRFVLVLVLCGLLAGSAAASDSRAPSFSSAGFVNAASGQAIVAPYSICSLYGTDLFLNGTGGASSGGSVPANLGGVVVLIGSTPAGLFYLSPGQINLLIPSNLLPGTYAVTVVRDGVASQAVPISVQELAPALFSSAAGFAAATHADGSPITEISPAIPGEVIVLYATGLGKTQPNPIDRAYASGAARIVHLPDFQLLLDGVPLDRALVQYAGLTPSSAGLYQVNVQLPATLGANNPVIQVSVGGLLSPDGVRLITGPVTSASKAEARQ